MAELRILVCDDDPDMLELMLRRLDKMGFKPDRAGDGGVAQNLIKENHYDLIVTDIYMPEATGLELLEMAKQRDPHVQVVIVTASATLDNAIDALNHGAFGYLSKPFDHLSVFDSTVSRALEFRQLIMANKRMAEAQKMRGDMLEDEVAKRVGQLREKQQGLLDLLNCLPDGIVVVEEGGKLMMTSPTAEQWLARDRRSDEQPIAEFIGQLHSEWAEDSGYAQLGEDKLRLLAIDYPHPNGKRRKAVIIRRSEEEQESAGPGTLAVQSMAAIKEGLAWLFRQKLSPSMQQRIKELANHLSTLEQVTGTSVRSDPATRVAPASLTPAVLPEYLHHEPALDEPGAQWEETAAEASGANGRPALQPEPDERIQPDAVPTGRSAGVEPPVQPEPETAPEAEPEAADAGAEPELALADAEVLEEAEEEAEVGELPIELEPPATEQDELILDELPSEEVASETETHDEAGAIGLEDLPEPEDYPANAPTKVLARAASAPTAEAPSRPIPEEDAASGSPEGGRIPLWQRITQKHGAVPAPAERPAAQATDRPAADISGSMPEPGLGEEEDRLSEVAARLEALGEQPAAVKPGSKPKGRDDPAKPPRAEASPKPKSAVSGPPKAGVTAKPARAQRAPVREPELAGAGASSAGKRKGWPPKLPSQDPDFDPELDVSG